jgi:hypothetical protein
MLEICTLKELRNNNNNKLIREVGGALFGLLTLAVII